MTVEIAEGRAWMGQQQEGPGRRQSGRQAARREAFAAQAVRRETAQKRERRLTALAVTAATALGELEAARVRCEAQAGAALAAMVADGLTPAQLGEWVGPTLTLKRAQELLATVTAPRT